MLLANVHVSDEVLIAISLPIIGAFLLAITAIITYHKRKMQRDDMEATLKMEMIERGMSSEDIERVLAARMSPACWERKIDHKRAERAFFQR